MILSKPIAFSNIFKCEFNYFNTFVRLMCFSKNYLAKFYPEKLNVLKFS